MAVADQDHRRVPVAGRLPLVAMILYPTSAGNRARSALGANNLPVSNMELVAPISMHLSCICCLYYLSLQNWLAQPPSGREDMRANLVGLLIAIALAHSALAQQCGEPPRVDDQMLKGEIDGKAKFLSTLVGDAGLKGQVEMAKTDIFSKYPNADKLHSDTYLLYMFCTSVLSDAKLSSQDKLHAILDVQKALLPSPASSGSTVSAPGGVAVGRDVTNSPITVNPSPQPGK